MTREQTDKIFYRITSNGCREMEEERFNQAVKEAVKDLEAELERVKDMSDNFFKSSIASQDKLKQAQAENERVKAEKKSWQKALIESDASKNLGRAIEAESLLKQVQAELETANKKLYAQAKRFEKKIKG